MNLKQALQDVLNKDELALLIRSYDVVGDIAVIAIPPALQHREQIIGKTIMALNRRIHVVARRDGHCQGEYRTRQLSVIAGEKRLATIHREFGVSLAVNLQQTYFSPRSGHERKRIAGLVSGPETILVMFSGIAPYPLTLARHSPAATIVGVEKNDTAHGYGLINLKNNKAAATVSLFLGDVRDIVPRLGNCYDRIIMPLPAAARDFLGLALAYLRPGGRLHFYDFQPRTNFGDSAAAVEEAARQAGRSLNRYNLVVCGHNSPTSYRICVDATIG